MTAFLGGKPALDFDSNEKLEKKRICFVKLDQQGIVGDVNVALIRQTGGDRSVEGSGSAPLTPPTVHLAGTQVLKKCVNVGGTVRMYSGIEPMHSNRIRTASNDEIPAGRRDADGADHRGGDESDPREYRRAELCRYLIRTNRRMRRQR